MTAPAAALPRPIVDAAVRAARAEDFGQAGDLSMAAVPLDLGLDVSIGSRA